MMAIHALRLLAKARKNRSSVEHTDLLIHTGAIGEASVEKPGLVSVCSHPRVGQEMGR
jgi:hypothetical protein